MSSGWNGIGLRGVGRTRRKLAEMIGQLTGILIEAHELQMTNPNVRHFEDCCVWDGWGILPAKDGLPARRVHVYSWDTMGACVKQGICTIDDDNKSSGGISPSDFEICAK